MGLSNYGANTTLESALSVTPSSQRRAIAGGTVGGVVVGILIGLCIFYFCQRATARPSRSRTVGDEQVASDKIVGCPPRRDGRPMVVEVSGEEGMRELEGSVPLPKERFA